MMRTPATLAAAILLLAGGCSGPAFYWHHPDRRLTQAKADYCDCKQEARKEAGQAAADEYLDRIHSPVHPPYAYALPHDDVGVLDHPFDTWSPGSGLYEQNVFNGCMKRKGYRQLKSHLLPSRLRTKRLALGALAGR